MTKTLDFAYETPQEVKVGDDETTFTLVCKNEGRLVDLTTATSITVKIGDRSGYLRGQQISIDSLANLPTGQFNFSFGKDMLDNLPTGNYFLEVWVTDAQGTSIYPSGNPLSFTVTANIENSSGASITTIAFDDFVEAMNKAASTIAKGDKGDTPDLSNYVTVTDLNNGLSTKVTDNKNGTEQLNGVQVQPFNKLSDTIGGRNMATNLDDILIPAMGDDGWRNTTIGNVTPKFFKIVNQGTTQPITLSFEINASNDPTKTHPFDRISIDGCEWGIDGVIGTNYFSILGFKWFEIGNNVWKGTYTLQFDQGSNVADSDKTNINLFQLSINKSFNKFTVLGDSLCLYWGTQAIDWTPAPEDKADDSKVLHLSTGDTASRPTSISTGYQYFDISLNKPIWYTGKNWVDATGTTV